METLLDIDDDIYFDFSRHPEALAAFPSLLQKLEAQNFSIWRTKLLGGGIVNISENRPALHTAVRNPQNADALFSLNAFSDKIRNEKKITDIVNIGIGGSDLGPAMVYKALSDKVSGPRAHYVSNIDEAHLAQTLKPLNPATTFFLLASKTFTTSETLTNALNALQWQPNKAHYAALTANAAEASKFGIAKDQIFEFPEAVGGRYSVWSSIGLSLCIAFGFDMFKAFLAGGHAMDIHFANAPPEQNLPVIAALISYFHITNNRQAQAVLPYTENLSRLPAYLQQLVMESNGKAQTREGTKLSAPTCPVIFGEAGTGCQHSFMQFIHECPTIVPVDFIGIITPKQNKLMANMLAQAQALAAGKRPASIILLKNLSAYHLGLLLAFYEHRVFTESVLFGINAFDQPGVEMGKKIAKELLLALETPADLTEQNKNLSALLKILDN